MGPPDGTAPLRERKKAATRDALQEAALRLFAKHGFAAVSVDRIAAEADVSRSTFFRYFGSKEAILFAQGDAAGAELVDLLRKRPASETSLRAFEEALVELAEARSIDSSARRESSRLLDELMRQDPVLNAKRGQAMERWIVAIAHAFAERAGRTEPSGADRLASATCIAVAQEIGREWRQPNADRAVEVTRQTFAELRDVVAS